MKDKRLPSLTRMPSAPGFQPASSNKRSASRLLYLYTVTFVGSAVNHGSRGVIEWIAGCCLPSNKALTRSSLLIAKFKALRTRTSFKNGLSKFKSMCS